MAVSISNVAAIASCDAIVDLIDAGSPPGFLDFYEGNGDGVPASADTAITDQNLLAHCTLNNPAFGAAADGTPGGVATLDIDPVVQDASADASGDAAFCRYTNQAGTCIIQGSVTATGGGGDVTLVTITLVATQPVTITSCTFTQPET